MGAAAERRRRVIKEAWPDKRLYAVTLLVVNGILGCLYGILLTIARPVYSDQVPQALQQTPPWVTALASLASALLAAWALRSHRHGPAYLSAGLGFAALGFLGIGSLVSLVALGLLFVSRAEGEQGPRAKPLASTHWPDKALAASVVTLMTGAMNVSWGFGMLAGVVAFDGYLVATPVFGTLSLLVGFLDAAAAWLLYAQRGPVLAGVGVTLGALPMALYVAGPLLAGGGLVLLVMAVREREFGASPTRPPRSSNAE